MSQKVRRGLLMFFGITAIFTVVSGHHLKGNTEVVAKNSVFKNTTVTFRNAVVNADVADTESLREKGLSGRASLPERRGMWFVYQKDGIYSYWMPDMYFPIDIIWFDGNLRAVYLQENATPESYPHVFTPNVPARYVLEVPKGFVQKNGVLLGDKVSVSNSH
jgi:uncharacterized membrane protein (UPF0127 family)